MPAGIGFPLNVTVPEICAIGGLLSQPDTNNVIQLNSKPITTEIFIISFREFKSSIGMEIDPVNGTVLFYNYC